MEHVFKEISQPTFLDTHVHSPPLFYATPEESLFQLQTEELESTESIESSESAHQESRYQGPPDIKEAYSALEDITNILRPKRKNGIGHLPFNGDELLRERLQMMQMFLHVYTGKTHGWIAASKHVAYLHRLHDATAKNLRKWTHAFMAD